MGGFLPQDTGQFLGNPMGGGGSDNLLLSLLGLGGQGYMEYLLSQLLGNSQGVFNQQQNQANQIWNTEQGQIGQIFPMQEAAAMEGLSPTVLSSAITAATKPLSSNLVNSVMDYTVGPALAKSGLSESPGMATSILGQALAPYQQQEQQMAEQAVLQGLQLPFRMNPMAPPMTSLNVGSGFGSFGNQAGAMGGISMSMLPLLNSLFGNSMFGGGNSGGGLVDSLGTGLEDLGSWLGSIF